MTTLSVANHTYPSHFVAAVDQQALSTLAESEFHTHTSLWAEKIHQLSELILLPARWNVQLLGRTILPLPGANKDHRLTGLLIRICAMAFWILTIPVAILSSLIGLPLRYIDHHFRPMISYINHSASAASHGKSREQLLLTENHPLHIRTHNLGFVTSGMSSINDLRHPLQRAKEMVAGIVNDPAKPDIIFFQEAFHEDATKHLCEGIKEEYPYIIHHVAPQISGFNSGALIAGKYPIDNVHFQRLEHMLGPEKMSPRGIIKVRLTSPQGPVLLYGVHLQAMLGEERSRARFNQIEEIKEYMKEDLDREPQALQVLMGDFNTSRVTAWGEDQLTPGGQAEEAVLSRLDHYFDDLYLKDHHPLTGQRTNAQPYYLQIDNQRMNENLVEPSGSWYYGPYADPGILLSTKMSHDRRKHRRPPPQKVNEITLSQNLWGTKGWHAQQAANTARIDYILLPKEQGATKLDGMVEIRRAVVPHEAQSAPSDHLPVDGRIWIRSIDER